MVDRPSSRFACLVSTLVELPVGDAILTLFVHEPAKLHLIHLIYLLMPAGSLGSSRWAPSPPANVSTSRYPASCAAAGSDVIRLCSLRPLISRTPS
jgi:hypothetical protein